jgi:hypothetical protein
VEDYTDPEIMYENFGNEADIVIDGGVGGTVPSTVLIARRKNRSW